MQIGVPKELWGCEQRVALVPKAIQKLLKMGFSVTLEEGAGERSGYSNEQYLNAGAVLFKNRSELLCGADILLRVRKPAVEEVAQLKKGVLHVSLLDPFREKDLVKGLSQAGASTVSLEMIPRTTLAQKMDVLSSQASLAGYSAVIHAAEKTNRVFPMMMTPAGTISPIRVFVIGAGVAGLQAIATAKRLGARVEAYDTRPVAEEQVKSLGAKYIRIELGETGQTAQGYAKPLSEEQIQKQREILTGYLAQSDIIISTAQVFGKKAPLIITTSMLQALKPGTLVIDLAVDTGGNVEGSKANQEINIQGVRLFGFCCIPCKVAYHASEMFSNNVTTFLEHLWKHNHLDFNLEDEIIKNCLITHQGKILRENL